MEESSERELVRAALEDAEARGAREARRMVRRRLGSIIVVSWVVIGVCLSVWVFVDDAGGYWSRGLYISSENIRSTIAFPDAWSLYEVWQSLVCAVRSLV